MEPVPSTSSSETATSRDPTAILSDKFSRPFPSHRNSSMYNGNAALDQDWLFRYINPYRKAQKDTATKAATGDEQLSSDNIEVIDGDEEINNM
nr:unnamed protein product [Callosobruchus analis]